MEEEPLTFKSPQHPERAELRISRGYRPGYRCHAMGFCGRRTRGEVVSWCNQPDHGGHALIYREIREELNSSPLHSKIRRARPL